MVAAAGRARRSGLRRLPSVAATWSGAGVREAAVPSIHVSTEPRIGTKDASCVEVCPVQFIHEGEDQYYVDPDECNGWSACTSVCPVNAIYDEDQVPEPWKWFIH